MMNVEIGYHASPEEIPPAQFEQASAIVNPEPLLNYVSISADPRLHLDWGHQYRELGFDKIVLHNVHPEQEKFIEVIGSQLSGL